jgi:hypothetical protein
LDPNCPMSKSTSKGVRVSRSTERTDLTETLRGSGISSMRDAQAFYAAWPIASTAIGIARRVFDEAEK